MRCASFAPSISPCDKEQFTILVRMGRRVSWLDFNKEAGSGSSVDVLNGHSFRIADISSGVVGLNDERL